MPSPNRATTPTVRNVVVGLLAAFSLTGLLPLVAGAADGTVQTDGR